MIGIPTIVQWRARPDYYGMVLKVHYPGDSEILNYEYERDSVNTSEDEFKSDGAVYDEHEEEDSIAELVLILNQPQKNSPSEDE